MTGKFEYVFLPTGHENVENRELYVSDGFHPVLLGDILNDGRYRIVHKLGFGGFGTVWLARDSREAHYVSIKILTAFNSGDSRELHIQKYLRAQNGDYPGRQFISTLVDDFTLKGPNGHHLCLVYEALGPSIVSLRSEYGEAYLKIRPDIARQLAKQVGEALDFLHRSGLTYGGKSSSPSY
jgi:serine/threonine-protein kinase SRPK3